MPSWNSIKSKESPSLLELFEQDNQRAESLTFKVAGLHIDISKTHLNDELLASFQNIASEMDLTGKRETLFAGDIINPTEGRSALHISERGLGNEQAVSEAKILQSRMKALIEAIDAGAFGEIKHILHVGIGGSALGPKLLMDALGRDDAKYDVAIVSNVDGAAMAEAIKNFDPRKTLLAVASKTFTTTETLMNAQTAMNWMREGGVDDPMGRVIALTAQPDKALEFGIDESRILPFNENVGGRYSLWCSIGFPAAIGLGWDAFAQILAGAAEMDKHFQQAELMQNIPVLAAFADLYYTQARDTQTRAVFAYDERLRLLPDYLQQLEMESNGKSVTSSGEAIDYPTAPITWGGVGTDAQHAVFQLLHQGTYLIPVEFIASKTPGHDFEPVHHETLLTNCFAQGAALMAGKKNDDSARSYAGNRPSSTILVEDVTPAALGALLSYYEHRTFVNAVMLGINPFDQFGVELGKEIAKKISEDGPSGFDPSTMALMSAAFD